MRIEGRSSSYASLWVLALAFGWIEASVVVYLRALYALEASTLDLGDFAGALVPLISLPSRFVGVEMAREACTILLLGAVAWLAGRRLAARIGAFLLTFGIWDLTYYAVLRLVLGWPESPSTWDILFLIPLPWVAPVWAPVTVAALFVAAGSYLFWTSEHERTYRWPDIGVLGASVLLTITAFLSEWSAAAAHRVPDRFPTWLFLASVFLGTAWFVRVERRTAVKDRGRKPWLDVRVRPIEPEARAVGAPHRPAIVRAMADEHVQADQTAVMAEYREAVERRDALLREASELGDRLERDIRAANQTVEDVRERLILMGQADRVEEPDEFFH